MGRRDQTVGLIRRSYNAGKCAGKLEAERAYAEQLRREIAESKRATTRLLDEIAGLRRDVRQAWAQVYRLCSIRDGIDAERWGAPMH
jgi:hypothetical protein